MAKKETSEANRLKRTLGLKEALAIGVGTMVGAGIFVFPGIASGMAGPAALISFLIAGLVALIIAVVTAEIASALPFSGGGYYFVSRSLGPFYGFLVGIVQCLGLVFASAFYLVGLGEYTIELFGLMGISLGDTESLITLATALGLTLINIFGTRGVGRLQNKIVLTLAGILALLFLYGLLDAFGIVGEKRLPKTFAPEGLTPIVTTASLVFTSYLGFVQIAAVGGEIKNPQRNIPRALIGSVVIVISLYVLAIFVSNSILGYRQLGELGETATVEVARQLVGKTGALAVLGAGLLATLSSANASILSSSRTIFSVAKDALIPKKISAISDRYGTPHIAILFTGLPIAALTLIGNINLLSEVASLLHLIVYGLICVSLLALRKKSPLWYVPTFKPKLAKLLAWVGAIACFLLIVFMQKRSIFIGGGILVCGILIYYALGNKKELTMPAPPHIATELRQPRILVPVEITQSQNIPQPILKIFPSLDIKVIGYGVMAEQTSPEQFEEKHDAKIEENLEKIADQFKAERVKVSSEFVLTSNIVETVQESVKDESFNAILLINKMEKLKNVLLFLEDTTLVDSRTSTLLHNLTEKGSLDIELLINDDNEENENENQSMIHDSALKNLRRFGAPVERITTEISKKLSIQKVLDEKANENNLIIVLEPKKKERQDFIESILAQIGKGESCSLLVVLEKRIAEEATK